MDFFSYNLYKFQVGNYCWSACLKHCNLYGDHSPSLLLNSNSASGILTLVWKLHIILVRLYRVKTLTLFDRPLERKEVS